MRTKILSVIGLLMLFCACGSESQRSGVYTVDGELNDSLSDGKRIYIVRYDDNKRLDSTIVKGNRFTFTGKVDTASFCRIDVTHHDFANFILEGGTIKVDLEKYNYPSGTPMNEGMSMLAAKEDSIYALFDKQREKLREQYRDDEEYKRVMEIFGDSLRKEVAVEGKELFKAYGNNAVGEFLIRTNFMPTETEQLETTLMDLGPWLKSRKTVKQMFIRLEGMKNTAEGKLFVEIDGKDMEGKEVALSDYVGKGKYVLADFWASWCGPCKGEIPNLRKLHEQFKDRGLTVLGIFVWDKEENLRKAVEEEKVTWPQIFDSENVALGLYGIDGIPQIILFAPDGTIVRRNLRGDDMIQTVTDLITKK